MPFVDVALPWAEGSRNVAGNMVRTLILQTHLATARTTGGPLERR
jgi:hypothetical protein